MKTAICLAHGFIEPDSTSSLGPTSVVNKIWNYIHLHNLHNLHNLQVQIMAGRTIPVFCYWDGEVRNGAEGIDYEGPPPRVIRASNEITLNELMEMIYGITGWDRQHFELEIIGRFLAGTAPTRYFIALPIVDDASIASMFDMTISPQLGWNCVQLYLKKRPTSTDIHLHASQNVQSGSCNPLLTREGEASVLHSSGIFGEYRSPSVSADSIRVAGRPMDHNISEINTAFDLTCAVEGTNICNELRGDGEDEVGTKDDRVAVLNEKELQNQLATPGSEEELYVGQKFATKEELKRAVKLYSIKAHQQYKVRYSSRDLYVLKCKQAPQCPWHLRALLRNGESFFEITRLKGPHTCVDPIINKDHVQLDSAFIANEVQDFVKAGLSVAAIQKVIASRFNHNISYRKAWAARHKAMGQVLSDNEGSSQPPPAKARPGRPRKKPQPGDDAGSSQPSQTKPKPGTKKKKQQQPENDAGLSPSSQDEAPPTSKGKRMKSTG